MDAIGQIEMSLQKGEITPLEVINVALAYMRFPTSPTKEDKIRVLELMDML